MIEERPERFNIKLDLFIELIKEKGISFFGLGCLPTDKNGDISFEAWDLLNELLEYEPFLEYVRKDIFHLEDDNIE